jgi:type VI secretion system protein ImpB
MELPFVVGILADLSGNVPDPNRVPLRDRKYVEIDRDNFNDIMKSIGPKAQVNGEGKILAFEKIDDFSPIEVLKQLNLHERFQKRTQLSDVVAKLDGNVKLQQRFIEVLNDKVQREALKTLLDGIKNLPEMKEETAAPSAGESAEKPSEGEGGQK